jgi:lipopolysaccharide transport system permease protein
VIILTAASVIRQNKDSVLGSIWGLIQPFSHIVIISYFFGFLLKQPKDAIIMNLVGGLPLWTFIVSALNVSSLSLISRDGIIKKAIISKTIFPLADSLVQLYTLVYSFIAMYVAFIIFYPAKFTLLIFFIPILALPLVISVLSIATAVAFLTPYVRDIPQMLNVFLNVFYWTIPIMYPYSMVPESKRIFFELNPIFLLIRPVQHLITEGNLPSLLLFAKSIIVSIISVIASYYIHKRCSKNVVYYL